ncbi:MAG: DUF3102 domain-containing protein [Clostridium sp.]|uniref:DUF3102 domain-containing protein n=1 Tax=Clostridium sp. TaxID=1506 RepID=UPI0030438518
MNELVTSDTSITERTPELIAAEINNIKNQTKLMVLNNSIEIGRKLIEAKSLINHGKWAEWLEQSVDYSQRTANNIMRIFTEYGSNQISLFGNTNSQAFANLSYSQAVSLLGIPDIEEREDFVKENDIDNMSTRELDKAIKAMKKAEKEKEEAIKAAEEFKTKSKAVEKEKAALEAEIRIKEESLKISKENIYKIQDTLEREREGAKLEVNKLNKDVESIKSELEKAQDDEDDEEAEKLKEELDNKKTEICEYMKKVQELEEKLKEKPIDVELVEKVPEEIEKELEKLREKASIGEATSKFKANFNMIQHAFNEMFKAIEEIQNEEVRGKYKEATRTLIGKMNERL